MSSTILHRLSVVREEYGPNKGQLRGTIQFNSHGGETILYLNEEASKKIVDICADQIVLSAKTLAENMSKDVLTQTSLHQIESAE